MPRPKLRIHNHARRILTAQPAMPKILYPGMIAQFRYVKEDTTDLKPLVLVVWNDYQKYKIHGINLNFLTDFQIRKIMTELSDRGQQANDDLPITTEDQEEDAYDDNLPQRNRLKKTFTKIKLPTEKMKDESGNTLSRSQAETQMKRLYASILKKYVDRLFVYRTYNYDLIKTAKVVEYDIGGLIK